MKVVINNCYGGYGLSQKAYEFLGLEWDKYGNALADDRANPKLVECIEKLGKAADGEYACLGIVEIPDGIKWEIEDYDGIEWVSEEHRTWG